MIRIEFDMNELFERAQKMGASIDQVPFTLALALNKAAEETRSYLIADTWPNHVHQRNASFIGASLTTKDARAIKTDLQVEIYDKLDHGHMQMQAKGGQRVPRSSALAIGGSNVSRGARGVPASQKPRALKNAFRKGDVIYQRLSNGRLRLMYVLKGSAQVPKRVPFYEDFEAHMRKELAEAIPAAVQRAMATRR